MSVLLVFRISDGSNQKSNEKSARVYRVPTAMCSVGELPIALFWSLRRLHTLPPPTDYAAGLSR